MDRPTEAFIDAACVPLHGGHSGGDLDEAEAILASHPEVAGADIHAAAVLGDEGAVREFLAADPGLATATGGPRGWDALTHLCFSRYLRLDPVRSEGFVGAARALLDAGADPDTGWWDESHRPEPEWEPVLYGAAGVAHHPGLTRLLLERGAEPDDEEVVYHTPETYDNTCMRLLVETGRLTAESLSLLLVRKHDWHDLEGVRWLLEHGADPNHPWKRFRPLHHALRRDNRLSVVELLLDHGADPALEEAGVSAVALAARHGRGDVLDLLAERGAAVDLAGVDGLAAACARGDAGEVERLSSREPGLGAGLRSRGTALLARFAGNGNAAGVDLLLELGVDPAARWTGDAYWGIPGGSTALHVAAWRAAHEVVELLVRRGAPPDLPDGAGRTPLALAVRAGVDSHWKGRRAPDSIRTLLAAGASPGGIALPSGWDEADALLRARGGGR